MIPVPLALLIQLIPEIPKLVGDFRALFTKYPTLSPADLMAAIAQVSTTTDATADAILAKAALDAKA